MDQFTLENLTVGRGQKVQGYLDLPFTEKDKLPVTLIYGREEGPTVLLEGGLHNAEYVGIHTVIGLSRELEPEDIHGILIIINILNVNGFKARTVSVSAADGKNLNRVFPGDPEGTYSDRLADFMVKKIFPRIDYFIDVHNGDWFEDLSPFIYAVGNAPEETVRIAEEMAQQADVPYYVKSGSATGGAYNYAGSLGIPSVLLERGCNGMWTEEEAEASRKDVRNILRHIGCLATWRFGNDTQIQKPRLMNHTHYIDTERGGCWFPKKKAGQVARAGEVIGVMKDYFGNVIEEVSLREDCIILYQTISYSIPAHSPLIAYGHYSDCIDEPGHDHDHHHDHSHEDVSDMEMIHELMNTPEER